MIRNDPVILALCFYMNKTTRSFCSVLINDPHELFDRSKNVRASPISSKQAEVVNS